MSELAQLIAGWPMASRWRRPSPPRGCAAGRRRSALNQALHELRRPLQAVALASGPGLAAVRGDDAMELAASALDRLDREINGGKPPLASGPGRRGALVRAAVWRWQARGDFAEGSLALRWNAGAARSSTATASRSDRRWTT